MALSVVTTNGLAGLNGVYEGQQSPVYVGKASNLTQNGPLITGFTQEAGTVNFQAFFDPEQSARMERMQEKFPDFASATHFIGFIQSGELRVSNTSFRLGAYEPFVEVPQIERPVLRPGKRKRTQMLEQTSWVDMPEFALNSSRIFHPQYALWDFSTKTVGSPEALVSFPQQFGGIVKHCGMGDNSCASINFRYKAASLQKQLSLPLNNLISSYEVTDFFNSLEVTSPFVVLPGLEPDQISDIPLVLETFFDAEGVAPLSSTNPGERLFLAASNRLVYRYQFEFNSPGRRQSRKLSTALVLFFETNSGEVAFTYLDPIEFDNQLETMRESGPVDIVTSNGSLFSAFKRSRISGQANATPPITITYEFTTIPCAFIPVQEGNYFLYPFEFLTWSASRTFRQDAPASDLTIAQATPVENTHAQLRKFTAVVGETMRVQSNDKVRAIWLA